MTGTHGRHGGVSARRGGRGLAGVVLGLLLVLLTGCAAVQTQALRAQPPADLAPRVDLDATPFFPQTEYQCGPAALATALAASGVAADPARLGDEVFLPARTGTLQVEMIAGARRHGRVATRLPGTMEALLREVQAGHPVVLLLNLGLTWAPVWHYAVLVGYDLPGGDAWLRSGTTRRAALPLRTLEHTWMRAGAWAFVALPPGTWPATAEEPAVVEAAVGYERVAPTAEALQAYRAALARWPASLSLQMGLGNTLHAAGDRAGALTAFRVAAERHRAAPAWINVAAVALELQRLDEAQAAAREAVATADPTWRAQALQMQAQVRARLQARASTAPARPAGP